jgi:hypothetical protein
MLGSCPGGSRIRSVGGIVDICASEGDVLDRGGKVERKQVAARRSALYVVQFSTQFVHERIVRQGLTV